MNADGATKCGYKGAERYGIISNQPTNQPHTSILSLISGLLNRVARSRARGFCVLGRRQGLPPLSPHSFLRCGPDSFRLTKPNTLLQNRVASAATLRWCSGSFRNAVRLPSGTGVQLHRNPRRPGSRRFRLLPAPVIQRRQWQVLLFAVLPPA